MGRSEADIARTYVWALILNTALTNGALKRVSKDGCNSILRLIGSIGKDVCSYGSACCSMAQGRIAGTCVMGLIM